MKKLLLLGLIAVLILIGASILRQTMNTAHSIADNDLELDVRSSSASDSSKIGRNSRAGNQDDEFTNPGQTDFRGLSKAQLKRVEAAQTAYRDVLKGIEFRNSKLTWSRELDDRVIRLYEITPASKDDLKEAKKAVDSVLAESDMDRDERKAFVQISANALKEFINSNENGGLIFFKIPFDPDKNIMAIEILGRESLGALVSDLESSNGLNASFGNGTVRNLSKTEAGWRYEKFLMIDE